MKITANFDKTVGKIKPMHGVNGAPVTTPTDFRHFHYLSEAGIPFSRNHDDGLAYFGGGKCVDISNIFRDFDADETLPESYDFAFTDVLIKALVEHNVKPFFRLGESIENYYKVKAYKIYAPRDFEKWARICEHIIRHYNEGWADGFYFEIEYWEIWGEPEGNLTGTEGPLWIGTNEEFFRLYEITSNHLKKCFGDKIKVGGYSTCDFGIKGAVYEDPDCVGIAGPYQNNAQYHVQYMHDFLKYISSPEHKSPLDYFSWHTYSGVKLAEDMSVYVRKVLSKYGFADVEDYLTEWNISFDFKSNATPMTAANALAMMLSMQKKEVSKLFYYCAWWGRSVYSGLFNLYEGKPFLAYYAFMMFNHAYKLENEIETYSESNDVYVVGAKKDGKSVLLISNIGKLTEAELDFSGVCLKDAEVLMISDVYHYSPTGIDISNGRLTLPEGCCVEIRF